MTKQFLILITLFISLQLASAQDFKFFALGGPVVSQIDGDRIGGYDKMGVVAGLGVSHSINTKWNALMELEYISKGKGTYEESTGATYKTALHYLQLPLLAEYNVADHFYIETGLSFAYLMSYQFYENGEPTSGEPFQPLNFDLDWLIGGTYEINEDWRVNLRFSYSIIHMNEITETDYYRPNIWKHPLGKYNRSLALALQYWF